MTAPLPSGSTTVTVWVVMSGNSQEIDGVLAVVGTEGEARQCLLDDSYAVEYARFQVELPPPAEEPILAFDPTPHLG